MYCAAAQGETGMARKGFDDQYGLVFATAWPSGLRWVLVLPFAVLVFLAIRFGLGAFLIPFKGEPNLYFLVSRALSIVGPLLGYFAFVIYGAGMAPKHRRSVAIVLTILLCAAVVSTTLLALPHLGSDDRPWLIAASVSGLIGAIGGAVSLRTASPS